MNKALPHSRWFGLFWWFCVAITACLPTAEPTAMTVERPLSTPLPATTPTSPPPAPSATPLPAILPAPTTAITATTTLTNHETITITLNNPGTILYIQATASDKFGWSANHDGFIFSLPLDETGEPLHEPVLLSGESPVQWGPLKLSPDGSRLAILGDSVAGDILSTLYTTSGQIFRVSTIAPVDFFDWHTNNYQVLVWAESNGRDSGLWLLDMDIGEHVVLLTSNFVYDARLGSVGSGAVSPDGQTIVYTHKQGEKRPIWFMNSDGTNRRLIRETDFASTFAWSPDGQLIAFIGNINNETGVFIMNADGSNPHLVSQSFAGGSAFPLVWSPNSQMLAFNGLCVTNPAVDASPQPIHFQNNIHIVHALTGEEHPLLEDGCGNTDPTWSPDNTHVAFASVRSGNSEIWLAAINGQNLHQLTHYNGDLVRFPVWLPTLVP